ncbi:MAG: 2-hydroxymuconate tautomerase [Gammaproteobacteria bacterium]
MPIIEVNMLKGRSASQKRALITGVTDAVVAALAVKPEQVRILIRELEPEHFAVGGVTKEPLAAVSLDKSA